MTKKEAIKILASLVFNNLQAMPEFWNDPEYEDEIKALVAVGYISKEELKQKREGI
jgi:hypothetical protein